MKEDKGEEEAKKKKKREGGIGHNHGEAKNACGA